MYPCSLDSEDANMWFSHIDVQDIGVCYAFVEFEDISGVNNAIQVRMHRYTWNPLQFSLCLFH